MFRTNLCFFAIFLLTTVNGAQFPKYTIQEHPLFSMEPFKKDPPTPVIMNSYIFRYKGGKSVRRSLFVPRSASLVLWPSLEPFCSNLDTLFIPSIPKDSSNEDEFLDVQLTGPARVFVLIQARNLRLRKLEDVVDIDGFSKDILTDRPPVALYISEEKDNRTTFGSEEKWGENRFMLPTFAIAVEIKISDSFALTLPHPSTISVNGKTAFKYTLLFATINTDSISHLPIPVLPKPFTAFVGDEFNNLPEVSPEDDPPMANRPCPKWLHDLHVTQSRTGYDQMELNEPKYWRTWHPVVDPVYWCYYRHEHGAYPGNYRPMFGYTAWKKKDDDSPSGRQLESHEGFKIFSFPVAEYNRVVVVTVHIHLSRARRFKERFHTIIFAVCKEIESITSENISTKPWEMEMELQFKMDFGPAVVALKNFSQVPISSEDEKIEEDLDLKRIEVSRRFNILDLTDFPDNLDDKYRLREAMPGTDRERIVSMGIYEQWKGPLITCSKTEDRRNHGFLFEIRDPATAIKYQQKFGKDKDLQKLTGRNVNRFLKVRRSGFTVGTNYCALNTTSGESFNVSASEKVFYTNPGFTTVYNGPGEHHVRQFISDNFEDISLSPGHYTYVEEWNPWMELAEDTHRRFFDIENAIVASEN